MAREPVCESVTIAGRPERVAVARAFAAAVLGQHPAGETAVLLLSELVTNSVRHSASGLPGRTVTVTVLAADEVIRVEVADRGGVTVPALRPGGSGMKGGGRGLYLMDCLAARRGFDQVAGHTTTWFELQHRWPISRAMREPAFGGFRSISQSGFHSVFRPEIGIAVPAEVPGSCPDGHAGELPD